MNQFHTPSFGDEVFEMNETPMDQTQQQTASRRISRLSSLDQSTLVDDNDEEHIDYETPNTFGNSMMSTNQPTQQLLPTQSQTQTQAPAKPLAPYALFFRDTMTAIKQQNPACTLEQIRAIALNMWESMDDKQKNVYDQRHELEKREYVRQLRDYQRAQQMGDVSATIALQQEPPQQQAQQQQQSEQQSAESSSPKEQASSVPVTTTAEASTNSTEQPSPPSDQIQLLTEAAAVQKCTREQCNKPAIINPDWEDEYCSNECVVIHCRNVFTEWARSLQNSPT